MSFSPSPLISASISECVCEKLSSITCCVNSAPLDPRFCSYHQTPLLCAELLTTSEKPSPFTSYAHIVAQSGPRFAGTNVQGPERRSAGASYQPDFVMMSARPSPFTSPTPRPCQNRTQPGWPSMLTVWH